MILSGGVVMKNTRPEAHVMRELVMTQGVPAELVFLDEKACNTPENMIFSKQIS